MAPTADIISAPLPPRPGFETPFDKNSAKVVGEAVGDGVGGHRQDVSSGRSLYVIGTQQGQSSSVSAPSSPDCENIRV